MFVYGHYLFLVPHSFSRALQTEKWSHFFMPISARNVVSYFPLLETSNKLLSERFIKVYLRDWLELQIHQLKHNERNYMRALLCSVIGLDSSCHCFSQSDEKPQPMANWSPAFSRASAVCIFLLCALIGSLRYLSSGWPFDFFCFWFA